MGNMQAKVYAFAVKGNIKTHLMIVRSFNFIYWIIHAKFLSLIVWGGDGRLT